MSRPVLSLKRFIPIVIIVLGAIGFYGILPQLDSFSSSLDTVKQASPGLLIAAVSVSFLAYVSATCIYMSLALKPLRFGSTLLVQLAGLLINRIIPAGLGGLGLNFLYLRARKHGVVQAGAVVALNNSVGFVGHLMLLAGLTVFYPLSVSVLQITEKQVWTTITVVLSVTMLVALGLHVWRRRWRKAWHQLRMTVRMYSRRPAKVVAALLFSWGMTLSTVLALWLCTQAVGIHLSFYLVFVIYSVGVFAGTVIPTPGGLGGLEAAIVAGLVTQHVEAATALAAVLLFRLLTFWLGLAIGGVATVLMRQQRLLHLPDSSSRP